MQRIKTILFILSPYLHHILLNKIEQEMKTVAQGEEDIINRNNLM